MACTTRKPSDIDSVAYSEDWLVSSLVETLQRDGFLSTLCQPKQTIEKRVRRELLLESELELLAAARFGTTNVFCRQRLHDSIGGIERVFPATARPDLVIHCNGKVRILEVKSNRTDYQEEDRDRKIVR